MGHIRLKILTSCDYCQVLFYRQNEKLWESLCNKKNMHYFSDWKVNTSIQEMSFIFSCKALLKSMHFLKVLAKSGIKLFYFEIMEAYIESTAQISIGMCIASTGSFKNYTVTAWWLSGSVLGLNPTKGNICIVCSPFGWVSSYRAKKLNKTY